MAFENAKLIQDIKDLFESFVQAAVTAIEQRDPTTSGHSERVALLTVGLAERVDAVSTGPLAGFCFSRDQLQELRYAGLLHDFGKVGVREKVPRQGQEALRRPDERHPPALRLRRQVARGGAPAPEARGRAFRRG